MLNEHRGIAVVDGVEVYTEAQLQKELVPRALVRIGSHVYMDGRALTVGAPAWPYPDITFPEDTSNGRYTTRYL